ncbi:hypothetical protein OIU84_021479 [Salix udensis]|uniref:Uncharacterized protein n=1 Tax=Salix udensis TaxID=889485 RepID=A0AAD6PHJ0_9ROSI|nr:hypothetical protein OIU84_021479 [Salix udensis]
MNRGLKSENFWGLFFYLFQLMFENESDHRAIVEAEVFMDPIIRSVVSGFC